MRNNIRILRSMLNALMPEMRQRLLATLFLQPDRSWYLSELAAHLRVQPSSIQRELASLTKARILDSRRDGNRIYYRASPDCPVFVELQGLFRKTVGVAAAVREALEPIRQDISVAFLYGSFASGTETVDSDVDLLVVGEVGLQELASALRPLRSQLGRVVSPVLYTPTDLRRKLTSGNHFLTTVMQGPKDFIIGTHSDLAGLAESKEGQAAHHQQTGQASGGGAKGSERRAG